MFKVDVERMKEKTDSRQSAIFIAPLAPLASRMTTNTTGKRAATAAKKFQLTKQIAQYIWTRKKRRNDQ